MNTGIVLSGLAIGVFLWGPLAYRMARNRGRNVWGWYVAGVLIGLIALIALAIAGKTREKKAAEIPGAAAVADGRSGLSTVEELRGLADLHDHGALTDEEYAHEKEHVLAHH